MRLGSLVDCLAAPADAGAVVARGAPGPGAAARRSDRLQPSGIAPWCAALQNAGFCGPSNFLFASRDLTALMESAQKLRPTICTSTVATATDRSTYDSWRFTDAG